MKQWLLLLMTSCLVGCAATQESGPVAQSAGPRATAQSAPIITVTEFYHPPFDHYFITGYQDEAANLSAGNLPPWVPTGRKFKVWAGPDANVTKVWRFFSSTFAPKSSHFYTNNPGEAQGLVNGNVWAMEADNAFYMMVSPTGTCPTGTTALYRLYNNGQGGAPNHRYVMEATVRTQMIAAGWVPEGNGPDGVFACVPLSTALPPPTGSPFQQDVMYYMNTLLGFASGDIANVDQIKLILTAGVNSLLTPGSTCPIATTSPPLESLVTLPPTLTITFDFGNGCRVASDTAPSTVAGKAVVVINNLILAETAAAGNATITLSNLSVNGVPVASGGMAGQFEIIIDATSPVASYAGNLALTLNNLQLANAVGFNGTLSIRLNTAGTSLLTTNLVSSPSSLPIQLNNMAIVRQPDDSLLVNTIGTNVVGGYTVSVVNVRIDPALCQTGAIGGMVRFTRAAQIGTVTFDSNCNYTYSGP